MPVVGAELDRLKREAEAPVAAVRKPGLAPTKNVVPARRVNTAPPIAARPGDESDDDEVVIEMSGEDDEDDPPTPPRAKSETLADPTTTQRLAEAARRAPAPAPVAAPNRHVKRRDG